MYTDLSDYQMDRYGNQNGLNIGLNFRDLGPDDYTYYTIVDRVKFRPDLIAKEQLGNENLYFIILWINSLTSLESLDSGKTIKIPTITWLRANYEIIKKEIL